ncbi:MAG: hypothetical protein ACXQTF_03360 [Candidatus Hecatellaceae archaeon]
MRRRVSTVCSLCVHECGIEVEVENGRPVRVRGLREHGVSIPHGWPGLNRLFGFEPSDPATGYAVFKGLPCRVRPV